VITVIACLICFVAGGIGGIWLGAQAMIHKLQAMVEEAKKLV
jgi:hypothetical protein